jgi:tRNA threonylcarbamoyladenosine biosynthesis protein TsaE
MPPEPEVTITHSDRETEEIARALGRRIGVGTRVHLFGDLGAGKTAFIRGLADGLGVDPDEVTSPTFTLIQEYRGRVPLYHVDLYRLTPLEVPDLGLDALAADGVLAVEWAERLPDEEELAITVHLEDLGGDDRRITIRSA